MRMSGTSSSKPFARIFGCRADHCAFLPFSRLLSHLRNALESTVRHSANGGEDRSRREAQAQGSLHPGMLIWRDCSPSMDIFSSFAKTAVNLFDDFCLFCLSCEFVARKT